MTAKKYDCETMFDAPEPYGIMVQVNDGSYVSADDYETLKEAALELLMSNSSTAKDKLAVLLGIELPVVSTTEVQNSTVTVEIQFTKFDGDESSADKLYGNPDYDDSFQFKVKNSNVIYTGNLGWEQGHGNNYRFYVGYDGADTWFSPSEVTHVEVK